MQKQTIDQSLAEGNHIFFSTEASIQQFSDAEMDISMVYSNPGMRTKPICMLMIRSSFFTRGTDRRN